MILDGIVKLTRNLMDKRTFNGQEEFSFFSFLILIDEGDLILDSGDY